MPKQERKITPTGKKVPLDKYLRGLCPNCGEYLEPIHQPDPDGSSYYADCYGCDKTIRARVTHVRVEVL